MEMTSFAPEEIFLGAKLVFSDAYRKSRFPPITRFKLCSVERQNNNTHMYN